MTLPVPPAPADPHRPALPTVPPAALVWLTGLSGAGKSTLAQALQQQLRAHGRACCVLDGDRLRQGLNRDLGFSDADRRENIRRVAEVARLMVDAGLVVISACISPFAADRAMARALLGAGRFLEVHVDVPLAVAEARDVKGLYRRARAGELRQFTGIDSPYEVPARPELRLDTARTSPAEATIALVGLLQRHGLLTR